MSSETKHKMSIFDFHHGRTKLYHKCVEGLPDVSGKVFTGTTSGTGNVAARTVANLGGEAIVLNRKS